MSRRSQLRPGEIIPITPFDLTPFDTPIVGDITLSSRRTMVTARAGYEWTEEQRRVLEHEEQRIRVCPKVPKEVKIPKSPKKRTLMEWFQGIPPEET